MAMAHTTLRGEAVRPRAWTAGVRLPAKLVSRFASALWTLVAGKGGEFRGYPREGFPEIELHEIVAGRRERFDGLL